MNSREKMMHRMVGLMLAVLMVVSMFAAVPFTASAEDAGSATDETIYLDFNADNADVEWDDYCSEYQYWYFAAFAAGGCVEFISNQLTNPPYLAAGTYTLAELDAANSYYCNYSSSPGTIHFTDGSCTVAFEIGFVTLSGTFTGEDGKTYVVTITAPVEPIKISIHADNATVVWNNDSEWGYWSINAENDDYLAFLQNTYTYFAQQAAGTYTWQDMGQSYICYCSVYGYNYVYFTDGSCTVAVDGDVAAVCGTFLGDDGNTYDLTITNGSEGNDIPEPGQTNYTLALYPDSGSFAQGSDWESYPGDGSSVLYIEKPQDTVLTLPTASELTREGYTLDGWFTWDQIVSHQTDTGATSYTFTQGGSLYAHWTPNTYTVTVDPNGGYRNAYTSEGAAFRDCNPYTVSTAFGYWLRLFGNNGPIQRDGYRLVGFTTADGSPIAGSFVEPDANSSLFNDLNEYYYYVGPTDETLVAQWEIIAEDQIDGTIGENLTWSIENGVLTICGTGDMYDYGPSTDPETEGEFINAPWWGESYSRIVIQSGVTSVGNFAFYFTPASSVSIADTVTRLGTGSFSESGLTSVTIPGSVESWSEAFIMSNSLTTAVIESGVEKLDNMCFGGCENLTNVTIPDTVTTLGEGVFHLCHSLQSITIPDGVTNIGMTAFAETGLIDVTLPSSLTTITESMFAGCTALRSVWIPEGVREIEGLVFYGSPLLINLHIPASVQTIWGPIVDNCDNFAYICSPVANGAAKDYCDEYDTEFRLCDGHRPQPQDQISVTIGDQIGVNLLLDLDARDADSVTVVYKDLNGVEQRETFNDFSSLPQVEGGLYKIAVQIAPAQIADSVTVYIDGETLDANVKEYCNTLIGGGFEPEVAALAQAVLDYGQAANNFFDYTDETISAVASLSTDDVKAWTYRFSDTTGKLQSLSFMALTKPEFRFYMQGVTEAEASGYTVQASYADSTIPYTLQARFVKNLQGAILLEVTGVMAEYMDETIVVTIDGLGTITFAGNDFAKMMAENTSTEALGAALYAYGATAKACFRPDVLDTVDDGMEVPVAATDDDMS